MASPEYISVDLDAVAAQLPLISCKRQKSVDGDMGPVIGGDIGHIQRRTFGIGAANVDGIAESVVILPANKRSLAWYGCLVV